jgi:precorrin-6Y C5,15-methyltransferase (decarboxylating)
LNLKKDAIIWDIGTASGSVAIEAARISVEGQVYAVEVDSECVAMARENCRRHKVDNVQVIEGRAPGVLIGLPRPDAVFIGGSKGSMRDILDVCLEQLTDKGSLVVNAITMENVQEAYQYFQEKDLRPEIILLQVSRGVPLARYHRYEALNPVHIFAVTKGDKNPALV